MSNLTKSDIKEILLEELEQKKTFEAKWNTECAVCGEDIVVDDSFCFLGNAKKVCTSCYRTIVAEVENIV